MYGEDGTTSEAEWFSIQIQITCAYLAGGCARVPQAAGRVAVAPGTNDTAASAAATAARPIAARVSGFLRGMVGHVPTSSAPGIGYVPKPRKGGNEWPGS